ncbi:MAG: SIR2 family NAD-dependent protein deacylase [Planctomycetota bacterium]
MNNSKKQIIDPAKCAEFISQCCRIVVFTGAGISTAAGIPDFRGPEGLYVTKKYDPDTVFSIDYFYENPLPFFDFSRDFISVVNELKPTFTHHFIAELEKQKKLTAVITQNIDPLHSLAGSERIISVHGSYADSYCVECRAAFNFSSFTEKLLAESVPQCSCGGVIKPDVVFFGEQVKGMMEAEQCIAAADLLIVMGSSLTVYPAAYLPQYAVCRTVLVNQGDTNLDESPDRWFAESELDEFFRETSLTLDRSNI